MKTDNEFLVLTQTPNKRHESKNASTKNNRDEPPFAHALGNSSKNSSRTAGVIISLNAWRCKTQLLACSSPCCAKWEKSEFPSAWTSCRTAIVRFKLEYRKCYELNCLILPEQNVFCTPVCLIRIGQALNSRRSNRVNTELNISVLYYRCTRCGVMSSLSFTWAPVASAKQLHSELAINFTERTRESVVQAAIMCVKCAYFVVVSISYEKRNPSVQFLLYIYQNLKMCHIMSEYTGAQCGGRRSVRRCARKNPKMKLFVMSWPAHKTRMHVYTERVFGGRKFGLHSELTSGNSRETSSGTCVNRSCAGERTNEGDMLSAQR